MKAASRALQSNDGNISANAMTICKSQSGTFEQMGTKNAIKLVHAVLSRVRYIEGLFLVTPDDEESNFDIIMFEFKLQQN